jgi:hypothetical protein
MKILAVFGDMREQMAILVRDMWHNLGRNKSAFVDENFSLVHSMLRMTLVGVSKFE